MKSKSIYQTVFGVPLRIVFPADAWGNRAPRSHAGAEKHRCDAGRRSVVVRSCKLLFPRTVRLGEGAEANQHGFYLM